MDREQTFLSALTAWEAAKELHILAAEQYREAHARFTRECPSEGKPPTDSMRKAYADEQTSRLRLDRDFAERAEIAAHHRVVYYRGTAGERGAA